MTILCRAFQTVVPGLLDNRDPVFNKFPAFAADMSVTQALDAAAMGMPQHNYMLHLEVANGEFNAALVP